MSLGRQRSRRAVGLGRLTLGGLICASAAVGLVAGPATAQVAWESPMMVAPGTPAGLGIFLTDPHPGNLLAGMVTFRARGAPNGMGLRFGITEEPIDEISIFGGADFSGPLLTANAEFPLDVIWVTGIGAGFSGDEVAVGFPLGVSAGRVFDTESARFVPYLSPRLVLNGRFGGGEEGESLGTDNLSVEVAIDLGIDFAFSNRATLRFGASIGDRDAVAVGLNFGGVR